MRKIEFLGIPGSGKTTIQNRLIRKGPNRWTLSTASQISYLCKLLSTKPDIFTYTPKTFTRVLLKISSFHPRYEPDEYAIKNYRRDETSYTEIVDIAIEQISTSEEQRKLLQYWFDRMAAQYVLSSRTLSSDWNVLIDEGFVQRSISTFCSTNPNIELDIDAISNYLHAIPKPDILIIVAAPIDTVEARLEERSSGWPRRCAELDRRERMLFLQRSKKCVEFIKKTVTDSGISSVYSVDTTTCLEEVIAEMDSNVF